MIAVPTPSPDQQSADLKWGISVLYWHAHAVNIGINHPIGVYVAFCGHLLMMVTKLHDAPPTRVICPVCTERSGQ